MKHTSKNTNIITYIVILTLIVLCAFNITYSYFTSTATKKGDLTFANLDVKFSYTVGANSPIVIDTEEYEVIPSSSIRRGVKFGFLTTDGQTISSLNFNTSRDSCDCYIRFKVDAFKTDDNTTNYGRYFELSVNSSFVSKKTIVGETETNVIYYMNDAISAGLNYSFATGMTLLANAPVEMLNSEFRVVITYKAVQSANEAYKSEFNDEWGYLESWR